MPQGISDPSPQANDWWSTNAPPNAKPVQPTPTSDQIIAAKRAWADGSGDGMKSSIFTAKPPAGGAAPASSGGHGGQAELLALLQSGVSPQEAAQRFNQQYGRTTGNEAVFYPDSNSVSIPEGKFYGGAGGWQWSQNNAAGSAGGPGGSPGGIPGMDPSYDFDFGQGVRALQASAASRGTLLTGGTLKALASFGQGLASHEYQNAFNRNYSLAQLGENAAAGQGNVGSSYAANAGNALTNNANGQGAAAIAQGNAWSNAINQGGSLAALYSLQNRYHPTAGGSAPGGLGAG